MLHLIYSQITSSLQDRSGQLKLLKTMFLNMSYHHIKFELMLLFELVSFLTFDLGQAIWFKLNMVVPLDHMNLYTKFHENQIIRL